MEIRRLKPEEHILHDAMRHMVFFENERINIREMLKNPIEHAHKDDKARFGLFDAKGKLQSAMTVIPFTMRMNGHDVKMGGVASVVTLPEARGKGHVRQIFEEVFQAMINEGQIFSALYPFSFQYYRKFGYELCYQHHRLRIPIEQFSQYASPNHMEAYEPSDSIAPFADIYEDFARDRNLSIVRNDAEWKELLARDPYQKLEFTYLHYGPNGRADAYILYDVGQDAGNIVDIKECCWKTPQALRGVLGFIAKLGAEFKYVNWIPYDEINIHALFPDAHNLQSQTASSVMNRLVNVQAALATLRAPEGSGKVTISVEDKFLQENTGMYAIEWESGQLTAKKGVGLTPDMETTVGTLTQLVTGYLSPEEARYKLRTNFHRAWTELTTLFPKQKIYMMERF